MATVSYLYMEEVRLRKTEFMMQYVKYCGQMEKKSMRMAESCQILPWKSCGKAVTLHEKIRWISYWQLEAAPYAIMPRLYLFPFIAKKIRGRNIICGWRMYPVRLFQ